MAGQLLEARVRGLAWRAPNDVARLRAFRHRAKVSESEKVKVAWRQ
jgi:hypothetical protein